MKYVLSFVLAVIALFYLMGCAALKPPRVKSLKSEYTLIMNGELIHYKYGKVDVEKLPDGVGINPKNYDMNVMIHVDDFEELTGQ